MKKILFITGTRADFGKIKSLIQCSAASDSFNVSVFVTGMHLLKKYGNTVVEVEESLVSNVTIFKYINHRSGDSMDRILANTILGLSDYTKEYKPDLIVIHGDRVEALASATVGALNNILTAHIEGGEVSGTIDDLIRHSVSKLSHVHFVCNPEARRRLQQMGERNDSIYEIGSPDIDVMLSNDLPSMSEAKRRYEIPFESYGILIYHPVTTELDELKMQIEEVVKAVEMSDRNFIVIHPNNDDGSDIILNCFEDHFHSSNKVKRFPSVRFEYFLTFLKEADFIIGNSSAGVREAPIYGVPCINIGSRQFGREGGGIQADVGHDKREILKAIMETSDYDRIHSSNFGDGNSSQSFLSALVNNDLWNISIQKKFVDVI